MGAVGVVAAFVADSVAHEALLLARGEVWLAAAAGESAHAAVAPPTSDGGGLDTNAELTEELFAALVAGEAGPDSFCEDGRFSQHDFISGVASAPPSNAVRGGSGISENVKPSTTIKSNQ